jgi:hypothetical protein
MATNGTISGTTKNSSGTDASSKYGTWISWKRNSTSIANNTSNITVTVYVQRVDGWTGDSSYNLDTKPSVTLKVGGATKTATVNHIDTRNQQRCTVATWSGNVTHNANGTLTLALSCTWTLSGVSALASGSISGSAILDTIPRYATCVQSLNSRTETTITMNWSSDSVCDYIWYSKDDGATWTGINVTDGKSGTYTISNLPIYTLFKIKTRVRRKDSQLTTDSSASSIATYNYPYCTSSPNFTIGDALTIGFYNPLGRQINWQVIGADGSLIAENSTTGTSYTGINGEESIVNLYKSLPNAESGTYSVKVAYGSIVRTRTEGIYSIRGTEYPTINAFTYKDNNSTTVGITGNNQHIVQNYSSLLAQVGNATANKGAGGIAKYVVECNGKKVEKTSSGDFSIGAVNSANNVDMKLTVTDTRGLSSSTTIKVTMLAHSQPTAVVTLERLNNYEDETYLTVDGSVASVNSKNTMAIKYRYKQSGGAYGSYVNTADRQKNTLSLDKNNSYIFNVVVTDAFGSSFSKEYVLDKGMFPLFIDTAKNSVGINCFPVNEKSLEVNGLDISTIKEFKKTFKLDANVWTNVGIDYTDLETGTYIMQVVLNNIPEGINNQWNERISGIVTWHSLSTNNNSADVIPVSKAGHSRNNHNIQLRVLRTVVTAEGYLRLQMMDDIAWSGECEVVFRFKRLI